MSPIIRFGMKFLALIFAICGLVGAWQMIKNVNTALNSDKWPTTTGEVVVSKVYEMTDVGRKGRVAGIEYLPIIEYEYTVNNQVYQSVYEKDGFQKRFDDEDQATAYSNTLPVGAEVKLYYNPANPDISVTDPGWRKAHWESVAIGLLMAVAGSGSVYFLLFVRLPKQ